MAERVILVMGAALSRQRVSTGAMSWAAAAPKPWRLPASRVSMVRKPVTRGGGVRAMG